MLESTKDEINDYREILQMTYKNGRYEYTDAHRKNHQADIEDKGERKRGKPFYAPKINKTLIDYDENILKETEKKKNSEQIEPDKKIKNWW